MECIYCHRELKQLWYPHNNFYFCCSCFDQYLVAILYSYNSWTDSFASVYLDYHSNNDHIRVGIQPFLGYTHIILNNKDKFDQDFINNNDQLIINIEGCAFHVMLHPHKSLKDNVELILPLTTLITPQNVKEKISQYLLFS